MKHCIRDTEKNSRKEDVCVSVLLRNSLQKFLPF